MNAFAITGAIIALLTYLPLCYMILRGTSEQNMATFVLWGLMDGIAGLSSYVNPAQGNYLLPLTYVGGCMMVIICIVIRSFVTHKLFSWGKFEWFVSALVAICAFIWWRSGDVMATFVSTIAMCLASGPLLVDTWKKPRTSSPLTYIGFVLANFITIFAGTDWSIIQRFYPTCATVLTVFFVILGARKWLWGRYVGIWIRRRIRTALQFA